MGLECIGRMLKEGSGVLNDAEREMCKVVSYVHRWIIEGSSEIAEQLSW